MAGSLAPPDTLPSCQFYPCTPESSSALKKFRDEQKKIEDSEVGQAEDAVIF